MSTSRHVRARGTPHHPFLLFPTEFAAAHAYFLAILTNATLTNYYPRAQGKIPLVTITLVVAVSATVSVSLGEMARH